MTQHLQFSITPNDSRKRLDAFLASRLGILSRMRIANLLAAGACQVNGAVQRAGYHLATGDSVEIIIDETNAPTAMTPEPIPLDIIYEDKEIIVINKPSGILVHPTRNTKSGTLLNALTYHLNRMPVVQVDGSPDVPHSQSLLPQSDAPQIAEEKGESAIPSQQSTIIRPGLIHRLDRATSGLMVVAKTQRALSILTKHFHHKRVLKRYTALVHGQIAEDEGAIIASIGEDKNRKPPRWV